jgi:RHS repeat-associated protein
MQKVAPGFMLVMSGTARTRRPWRVPAVAVAALLALGVAAAFAAPVSAETIVNSSITTNTTWTAAGSPYVLQKGISVKTGATLKVEPGVTVAFAGQYRLGIEGSIKALGTSSNPITFTSTAALSGSGAPGQYGGINIWSGTSSFSYAHFFYGAKGSGGYYAYPELQGYGGSVTVDHGVFEHNEYSGVGADGGAVALSYTTIANNGDGVAAVGSGEQLTITHSTISKNVQDGAFFDLTTVGPSFSYDTIAENGSHGIHLDQNCTSALSTFAHGEYNNIYANGPSESPQDQLYALYHEPVYHCSQMPVDWRNNYWGPDVYYYFNDPRCASTATPYQGHLAYTWSKPAHEYQTPVGPLSSNAPLYSEKVEGKTLYYSCSWDLFAIGPGEFLTSPVPNAGATPGTGSPQPAPPIFYGGGSEGGASEAAPNLNSASCGDPVNCVTGNLAESYRDLTVRGLNHGLTLSRTYNSEAGAQGLHGPFGYGWSSEFGQSLSLDPSGEAATVTNADGSEVTFTKVGESFTAPAWVQATLSKTGEGTYRYTLPNQRVFSFSSAGRLMKIEDRNGNTTTLAYNEAAQLETVTDPSGRKLSFAHNGEGLIERIKDPMGHVVKYAYEGGNLATVTEPGEETPRWQFKYNSAHELTTITDGRSGTVVNEYDAAERVIAQTDALKRKTTWSYEAGDTRVTAPTSVTDIQFANNLPMQITRAYGTASAATTKYEYDSSDNAIKVTDPDGHATKYEYDGEGNRIKTVDADENETKWTYDSRHDVLSVTTPRGETTTIKRDAHGNAEAIERPAPGSKTQISKYKYDAHGDLEQVTDPLERVWKYEYDSSGDRTAEIDPEGDKRTWSFDEDSHVISSVSPRGNVEGAEASKYTTKIERDAQERAIKITDPLGHATKYAYDGDGNLEKLTDPNGHTATHIYDADNELTKVQAPNGDVTETGYDEAGRVVSQTDGNKHTTKYERNPLGEVVEVIDPLSRKTIKEYDKAGNLTTLTDAAERTTTYKYDPANRLTEVSYSDGKTPTVKYEYDRDGSRSKMTDGSGTSEYHYDQLDRLTESTNGHGEAIGYEYDLGNEQIKLTYPNSKAVTYAFDKAGRLEKVTDWLAHTTRFSYNADSQETSAVWPTGTGEEDKYTYDEADRLAKTEIDKAAEALASLAYSRDNDGQLKAVNQTGLPGEAETTYNYDENNRLTSAGTTTYEYDAANNPTKVAASTNEYDAAEELTKGTSSTYSYDELGERTKATPGSGPATAYTYDQAGAMTSVTRAEEGGAAAIEDTYVSDGNGLRASQSSAGSTSYLSWDVNGALPLLLSDGTYNFIYGAEGQPVEQIDSEGRVLFLHHDWQGTTRLLTSTSGAIEGAASYDAYGNITGRTGSATTLLGYDGQYTNSDTGLIYLRARSYDPATAQFLTTDPAKAVTREPYGFAAESPLNFADPSGLSFWSDAESVGAGFVNGVEKTTAGVGEGVEEVGNFGAGVADRLTGGLSTEGLEELGVHPDTCSVGFEAGKVAGYGGLLVPGLGEEEVATEGIYVIEGAEGTYVGQSGEIATRLAQHVASGRFTQAEVDAAMRISVSGGRVAREVAEQQMIDSLGGIKGLLNLRNPIGPQRLGLMPQPYSRF